MSDGKRRGRKYVSAGTYPAPCPSGKRCYSSKRLAKQAAKKARATTRLWVYRCPSCDGFHLTSRRPRSPLI